jgi:hypothetical protein
LLVQANPIGIKPRGGSRGRQDRTAVLLVKEKKREMEKQAGKNHHHRTPRIECGNWMCWKKRGEKIGD